MPSKTFNSEFGVTSNIVEYFNIPLDKDVLAYVCPILVENNKDNVVAKKIADRMKVFLSNLVENYIKKKNLPGALEMLSHLHEPNEYHLGHSKKNQGKAVSKVKARNVYDSLVGSKLIKSKGSLPHEAYSILLFVGGIGQDIMSDIICNVCRDILSNFTENQANALNIKVESFEIEFFDQNTLQWSKKTSNLPNYRGKIILVPNKILSGDRYYSGLYNRHVSSGFIAPEIIAKPELSASEKKMIKTNKDGTRKAILKEIYKVYKKPKTELIEYVKKYNGSLLSFLDYAKEHYPDLYTAMTKLNK